MSTERPDQHAGPYGLVVAAAEALARGEEDGLPALLGLAAAELGVTQVAVFARDPEREGVDLVASVGTGATVPDEPVLAAAIQSIPTLGRTTAVDGVEGTAADLPLVVARGGIELGLGAIAFRWAGRPPGDADAGLLNALADLVAVALDRSRLATLAESRADRADRLAMMDGLTGLANSRTLDRVLELEVARAQRQNSPVSVAVFDIDGFAALNEQAGHDAGDDALREVAAALAGSVRLVDTVARTGADEFVVVAPGSAGRTVAERIVEAVGSLPPDAARRVTVSAGIARFPEDGASSEDLLQSARSALETARAAGAGRIAGGDGSAAA